MKKVRPLPVLYEREEDCCGCSACSAVCPKQAITMQPNDKGFDYPAINDEKCIRCELCMRVCPLKDENK